MATGELEAYLHRHIPLSREMGVRVVAAHAGGVTLEAPLGPNINHRSTVFGGSASALAILAAWSLLHVRLAESADGGRIVIQRNRVEYLRPMRDTFTARAAAPADDDWRRFLAVLARRGRARLTMRAELWCGAELAGRFEGDYVVLRAGEGGDEEAGGA